MPTLTPRIASGALAATLLWHAPARAQPADTARLSGHAVVLATHVTPMLAGRSRTEAYVTQPLLTGELVLRDGSVRGVASLSLEPLTLERGELGAGSYGEGYVDRRHPHTYAHELMVFGLGAIGSVMGSVALGRGFVPFGSDDPMMRPFVKFPVNHHLGQILERWEAAMGVRTGPVMLEGAVFTGAEPFEPTDWGSLDRFGDSWAARATVFPLTGVEAQLSYARVESPEMPRGAGRDQRKWSASMRAERTIRSGTLYGLAEWKRSTVVDDGRHVFSFGSILVEAELAMRGWRPAVRVERTHRPEEERTFDPFRSPWPHADATVLGITRWTIVGARLERDVAIDLLRLGPFVEASYAHVIETAGGPFNPGVFYGSRDIWTFNFGVRVDAGSHRSRMGRYGVAAASARTAHPH